LHTWNTVTNAHQTSSKFARGFSSPENENLAPNMCIPRIQYTNKKIARTITNVPTAYKELRMEVASSRADFQALCKKATENDDERM
jgi:hypothetical protein